MPNLLRRAAVAVAAATACVVAMSVPAAHAATASAPPPTHSALWAGYYSVTPKDTPPLWASVEFTVPKVTCSKSQGHAYYAGAMWVGIGGMGQGGIDPGGTALLEQTGIGVQCANNKKTTQPAYYPWWEVANTLTQQVWDSGKARVHAGDQILAQVTSPPASESPSSGEWEFLVIDYTSDQTWTHSYRIPQGKYTGATVEAITEWPEGAVCLPGAAGLLCDITKKKSGAVREGLVDLGQVNYTYADYGTADSSFLSIPRKQIELLEGGQRLVYPTGVHSTPGSDTAGDAFSTVYDSHWTRAFPK